MSRPGTRKHLNREAEYVALERRGSLVPSSHLSIQCAGRGWNTETPLFHQRNLRTDETLVSGESEVKHWGDDRACLLQGLEWKENIWITTQCKAGDTSGRAPLRVSHDDSRA